jgi:inner membrane protein
VDTITHIALGACIGEVLGKRQLGKKALVLGALAQSIPDFDFVFSLWLDPASNALAHRGFTHSFLFVILISLILAVTAQRSWGKSDTSFSFWFTFLGLQTLVHVLLDAFNAYGTAWFEPFSHYRVSFHTLFVADPFYSIPLGIAFVMLVMLRLDNPSRVYWASVGLILSSLYLGYGVFNKFDIDEEVKTDLVVQNIPHEQYFTTPTPFNNWLWFVVASNEAGSFVGYRSVFDDQSHLDLQFFPRNDSLLRYADDQEEVSRLKRFSQGYYTVELAGDTLIFNDLRFGQMLGWQDPKGGFVFHYYLAPDLDNKLVLQRGRFANWNKDATLSFIRRIKGLEGTD